MMLAWTCLVVAVASTSPGVLRVEDLNPSVPAHDVMLRLEDASLAWTLEDVLAPGRASRFGAGKDTPASASSSSAWWLRTSVQGGQAPRDIVIEFAHAALDDVRLHVVRADGRVEVHEGGAAHARRGDLPGRKAVFLVPVAAGETVDLFVRVQSAGAVVLDGTAWDAGAYRRAAEQGTWWLGLVYGLLVAAILYNLVLWWLLRDRSQLRFVLFLCAVTLFSLSLDGLAQSLFWPDATTWARQSRPGMLHLSTAAGAWFGAAFLGTRTHLPLHHRALSAFLAVSLLMAPVSAALPYRPSLGGAVLLNLLTLACTAEAGRRAWSLGVPYAGTFMIGAGVVAAGVVGTLVGPFIPVPGSAGEHALRTSACIVALVFTTALGRRMRTVDQERIRAQEAALQAEARARERVERINAELEDRVMERTRELREADARKDALVAAVSHDFRTPLTIIRQNVQTLLRDVGVMEPSDLESLLQGVSRQEERLTRMCTGLLDMARVRGGAVVRAEADLAGLVRHVAEAMKPLADERGITLRMEADLPVPVQVDTQRVEQALQNMVDNALKFTPRGGSVTLRARTHEGEAVLEVADTGPGIPEGQASRVFEPFFQVDGARSPGGGAGLGLAIVNAVAHAHGGTASVTSTPGAGATFRLALPLTA